MCLLPLCLTYPNFFPQVCLSCTHRLQIVPRTWILPSQHPFFLSSFPPTNLTTTATSSYPVQGSTAKSASAHVATAGRGVSTAGPSQISPFLSLYSSLPFPPSPNIPGLQALLPSICGKPLPPIQLLWGSLTPSHGMRRHNQHCSQ